MKALSIRSPAAAHRASSIRPVVMEVEMSSEAAASPAQALIIVSARPDRSLTSFQVDFSFSDGARDSSVMSFVNLIQGILDGSIVPMLADPSEHAPGTTPGTAPARRIGP